MALDRLNEHQWIKQIGVYQIHRIDLFFDFLYGINGVTKFSNSIILLVHQMWDYECLAYERGDSLYTWQETIGSVCKLRVRVRGIARSILELTMIFF